MSSLDNLPGDQRAVLEMVLRRGRTYDEIASLLSLERSAVRERAQIALDSIGPHTGVAPEQQHRIADYLLGQLPEPEAAEVRDLLADSPSDRAWARVVASELAPLTGDNPLPEIPVERSSAAAPVRAQQAPAIGAEEPAVQPSVGAPSAPAASGLGPAQPDEDSKRRRGRRRRQRNDENEASPAAPRSSRLDSAVVGSSITRIRERAWIARATSTICCSAMDRSETIVRGPKEAPRLARISSQPSHIARRLMAGPRRASRPR